jgi:hypothetical protein
MMEKISKTFSGDDEPKSSHAVFLETQVVANLIRIQKEIGWRRFRVSRSTIGSLTHSTIPTVLIRVLMFIGMPSTNTTSHISTEIF